jgi:hypothetical protein
MFTIPAHKKVPFYPHSPITEHNCIDSDDNNRRQDPALENISYDIG